MASQHEVYIGGVLTERMDDGSRTYTRWDGGEVVETRPYTDEENARADELDLRDALSSAMLELERATAENSAPAELAAVQSLTLASAGIVTGSPWVQPTGAHDAYPLDWECSHAGKSWRSTVSSNVWEPGVSGWVEFGTEWPDWVQPTGAHDAYAAGAKVSHAGQHWVSDVADNVWEPGVYGWSAQ